MVVYQKEAWYRPSDGNFYGVTSTGGTNKAGTIFKLTSSGTFSVMRHFNLITDGGASMGGLIIAPNEQPGYATPIKNVAVTEDVSKAITLIGNGSSLQKFAISTAPKNGMCNRNRRNMDL